MADGESSGAPSPWPRVLLIIACIDVALLPIAALGYRFGILPLQIGVLGLPALAVAAALLLLIACIIMLVLSFRRGDASQRGMLYVATVLPLLVVANMGFVVLTGSGPPIHDITTDPDDPPLYSADIAREGRLNSLDYDYETNAEAQRAAYPWVEPITDTRGVDDALSHAASVAQALGWEILDTRPEEGVVEAVDTTLWYGFKDDVVIRVLPALEGSRIDIRSNSRVGVSDLGANARRIARFAEAWGG